MTSGAAIPPVVPSPPTVPRRRCARHDEREAVGRCTVCTGGFCRECLTEHEDRLFCGPCFAQRIETGRRSADGRRKDWGRWKTAVLMLGSLMCAVTLFYFLGRMLAAIPAKAHDGTIWKEISAP
jgi:ribosomal protein S27AE